MLIAVGEVSDALAQTEGLKDRYAVAAERVKTLQGAIGNANLLFSNGMATYLEVITAQTTQLSNERTAADITTREFAASVQLVKALGGGWDTTKLPSP